MAAQALLDEPALGRQRCTPPSSSRIRTRSRAARCTPAVYQAAGLNGRLRRAASFPRRRTSPGRFDNGAGQVDDFRPASTSHARVIQTLAYGDRFRSAPGSLPRRRRSARIDADWIAPPLARYDFETVRVSTKAKFFIQGEFDEICPLKEMQQFYARCEEPKELIVIDAADHLFEGKTIQVGEAIEDLLGDWTG